MWVILLSVLVVSAAAAPEEFQTLRILMKPVEQEQKVYYSTSLTFGQDTDRIKRTGELEDDAKSCLLPGGERGYCMHLSNCKLGETQSDLLKLIDYICIIKDSTLGACCPPDMIIDKSERLAGELPGIASVGENALTRSKTENRGCGVSTRATGRTVGAQPANPREWPWMASITPEGFEQYCGGVLITDRHVLTAAHCTRRWKAEELYVRLGEYDMKRTNDSRTYNFRVVEKRQHEGFDHTNYHHDIAILKLHRTALFNTYVWPICLPPLDLQLDEEFATIIGWGTQWYGGPNSNVLMEVSVPIWSHQDCIDSFTDSVFDETLCAGGREGGKDACQGDSGGPLMYQLPSGRWTVIGVVSWGVRCGEPKHPGIYLRVEKYIRWIIQNSQF